MSVKYAVCLACLFLLFGHPPTAQPGTPHIRDFLSPCGKVDLEA